MLSAAHDQPIRADLAPIETEVRTSWRHRTTIRVSSDDLRIDGERIALADVIGVAYAATAKSVNVTQQGVARQVLLQTTAREHHIDLGCSVSGTADDPSEQTYLALVELLHHRIEPRIRARLLGAVLGGEVTSIGGLLLHRVGIDVKRRLRSTLTMRWSETPCALLDAHSVIVRRAGNARPIARCSALERNAVLLPELLESLLAELG